MLVGVRHRFAVAILALVGAGGCYLSHELPPCSDVPEDERCLTPPDRVEASELEWAQSFLHRDPRDGCIRVSVEPSMVEHRESLEYAVAQLRDVECMSLCFEDIQVVRRESLPDAPYIHLASEGACSSPAHVDLEPSFGCIHFEECRGTITNGFLSRSGPDVREWDHSTVVSHLFLHLGVPVTSAEVEDGIASRVERLLCAMYPRERRWCPGS